MQGLMLLPPAPGKCQFCAVKHEPHEAHNAQSLYYGTRFLMQHGREATWADAVAHCEPEIRAQWERLLKERNAWTEPPAGVAVIAEQGNLSPEMEVLDGDNSRTD